MPRVFRKTAAPAKKERMCCKSGGCNHPDGSLIQPGQVYLSWSFRYGGAYFMHADCGYPRRSQLTQSLMAQVYDAIDDAEESLQEWDGEDVDLAKEIVDTVSQSAQEVCDQYREADEAMGGHGTTQSAERADELEGWISELDSWDHDEFDPQDAPDEDLLQARADWADSVREAAGSAMGECPL